MDIQSWTEFLKTVDSVKTPVFIFFGLVFLGFVGLKVWQTMSSNKRSKMREELEKTRDDSINNLINAIKAQMSFSKERDEADSDITRKIYERQSDIGQTMEEVRNSLLNKVNKANSLRIIQAKFDTIQYMLGFVVERSLNYNHYDSQPDYVASRVKTDMAEILVDARDKLGRLDLSVPQDVFFRLQPEPGVERFWLCDDVWLKVEPLFRGTSDVRQRVERARLLIKNAVSDYVANTIQQMAKADGYVHVEIQKQAFDRNKRLHDTGEVLKGLSA